MQETRDEQELIHLAGRGDQLAFETLMSAQETRMYAVALRMCGNREDAQDCMQEAMIRIFRSISGFKGQSSFSTWVYRITMNSCLDELRRRKTRAATSLDANVGTIKSRISRGRERLPAVLSRQPELFGRRSV